MHISDPYFVRILYIENFMKSLTCIEKIKQFLVNSCTTDDTNVIPLLRAVPGTFES